MSCPKSRDGEHNPGIPHAKVVSEASGGPYHIIQVECECKRCGATALVATLQIPKAVIYWRNNPDA